MAFDSRQDSDRMSFRSLDGVDFFSAARFNIGANPTFYAPLDTPFEILERDATFAYRTHALTCCHSTPFSCQLLRLKSARCKVPRGACQLQQGSKN